MPEVKKLIMGDVEVLGVDTGVCMLAEYIGVSPYRVDFEVSVGGPGESHSGRVILLGNPIGRLPTYACAQLIPAIEHEDREIFAEINSVERVEDDYRMTLNFYTLYEYDRGYEDF